MHAKTVAKGIDAQSTEHQLDKRHTYHGLRILFADLASVEHKEADSNSNRSDASIDKLDLIQVMNKLHCQFINLFRGRHHRTSIVQRGILELVIIKSIIEKGFDLGFDLNTIIFACLLYDEAGVVQKSL